MRGGAAHTSRASRAFRGSLPTRHISRFQTTRLFSFAPDDPSAMPVAPGNFTNEFFIPPYNSPLPLETINAHPLDVNIEFDEASHSYFWGGQKLERSVTELVETFFGKFDPQRAIELMKGGRNWPRPEYSTKAGVPWTDQAILDYWDRTGEFARNKGTWMHYNIERFLNGYAAVPGDELPEMKMFSEFFEQVILKQNIQPYRTEWRVAAPEYGLAGSVDFVGRVSGEGGGYVLCDWKRSKKVGAAANSYSKKASPPIGHLEDTDLQKYFLQLNVYRYILKKYYLPPGTPVKMILASFYPGPQARKFVSIDVPLLEAEVEAIVAEAPAAAAAKEVGGVGGGGAPRTERIARPL